MYIMKHKTRIDFYLANINILLLYKRRRDFTARGLLASNNIKIYQLKLSDIRGMLIIDGRG